MTACMQSWASRRARPTSSATQAAPRKSSDPGSEVRGRITLTPPRLPASRSRHSKEALRSIIISQRLLGTREIAVFHHTGCGMVTFSTPQLRALVKDSDPTNAALGEVDKIDFLEFQGLEESVREDVKFLLEHPLVLPETKVTGWVYEVETGKVRSILGLHCDA